MRNAQDLLASRTSAPHIVVGRKKPGEERANQRVAACAQTKAESSLSITSTPAVTERRSARCRTIT